MTYFATRTEFSETNHPITWEWGRVRRLADELGNFIAKRHQTNDRIRRKGYLRLAWRSREQAERFQIVAEEMYSDRTTTRIFRNRRRFPK